MDNGRAQHTAPLQRAFLSASVLIGDSQNSCSYKLRGKKTTTAAACCATTNFVVASVLIGDTVEQFVSELVKISVLGCSRADGHRRRCP